jgi:hypothetical protein
MTAQQTSHMNLVFQIAWLAMMAGSMLRYYWPVTFALIAAVTGVSFLNFPFLRCRFQRRHLLVFAPLCVTLAILVWGSTMRHDDSQTLAPAWPGHVVTALLVIQLWAGIGVVFAMKGYRWFSTFVVLLEQWVGLACAFTAGMSVTGDWL